MLLTPEERARITYLSSVAPEQLTPEERAMCVLLYSEAEETLSRLRRSVQIEVRDAIDRLHASLAEQHAPFTEDPLTTGSIQDKRIRC